MKRGYIPAYWAEPCERGIRLFRENRTQYVSDASAYQAITPKRGCSPDSLRVWCRQADRDNGRRAGLTSVEMNRIKGLEREVRELHLTYEIVKKAKSNLALAKRNRPAPIMRRPRSEEPHDRT